MSKEASLIFFAIILGTILFLVLVVAVVLSLLTHKAAIRRHKREVEEKESRFRQELLRAQLESKEQTLTSISEEIHDNIGQMLSLVKLNLSTLPKDPERAEKKLTDTRAIVRQLSEDLRHLSRLLHPDYGDRGLADLMRSELMKIEQSGLYETQFYERGEIPQLPVNTRILLFRMIQELLNNILKHAQANRIQVWLDASVHSLQLVIQDNGTGCDPAIFQQGGKSLGMGIKNLYYRASLIEASLVFETKINEGTTVHLYWPASQ